MNREAIEKRLEELAAPLLKAQGLELVDLEFLERGPHILLRLYLDRPGGITVDQIADFSREFGTALDVENLIARAYTLEVSSPGLTRRLKKPREFRWALGRRARIVVSEPVDGRLELAGKLVEAGESVIVVEDAAGRHEVPFARIAKANLELAGEES